MKLISSVFALVLVLGGCAVIDGLQGSHDEGNTTTDDSGGSGGNSGGSGSTSGSWKWHAAVKLEQGCCARSTAPRLAVRSGGRAYAAWYEWKPETNSSTIWLTTRAPGASSWDAPKAVPGMGALPVQTSPQVAVGDTGTAVVVYDANDGQSIPTRQIRVARFADDLLVNPSTMERLDKSGGGNAQLSQNRSLAVDEAGRGIVVWNEPSGTWATMAQPDGTWSTPLSIDTDHSFKWATVDVAASLGSAIAVVSRSSDVVAVPLALGSSLSHGSAHYSTGAWGTVALRGPAGIELSKVDSTLRVDAYSGDWLQGPGTPGATRLGYAARVAMNAAGKMVAVWQQSPEGSTDFHEANVYAATSDGTTWSAPQLISIPGVHRKAWWISVDMNDAGDAVAAWADFDAGGTYTRIFATLLRNGDWGGPAPIDVPSPDAGLADQPENTREITVALDPRGSNAVVTWMQHDPDGTERAWANWLE